MAVLPARSGSFDPAVAVPVDFVVSKELNVVFVNIEDVYARLDLLSRGISSIPSVLSPDLRHAVKGSCNCIHEQAIRGIYVGLPGGVEVPVNGGY